MRIGLLGPIAWRTPPEHYGGWELVVSNLAEGLVRKGHEVTLFATADSRTGAHLEAICPRPLTQDSRLDPRVYETLHAAHAFEMACARQFEVLHNNTGCFPMAFSRLVPIPTLTTLHGSAAEAGSRIIYREYKAQPYVSISQAERELAPELNYVATVYNGIEVNKFPFSDVRGRYLLVIGRMSPDKGIHLAIEVAERSGMPLILAGIVPPENKEYFEQRIAPRLKKGRIEFVGPANHALKSELYSGAYAFLHLITYREAFGLTMAEAMACGTPVIGIGLGSVPELVKPGVSGFIIPAFEREEEIVAGAVAALGKVDSLERAAIRDYVSGAFSVEKMVDGYEQVYRRLLDGSKENSLMEHQKEA
jgi:glycosyltransferase involved in cell wall biosynthesis